MNKIITSDQVRKAILDIWPNLKFIVLSDPQWSLPSMDELQNFLKSWKVPTYIDRLYECEEIAMEFMVALRRFNASNYVSNPKIADDSNWPMGIVCGTRFNGKDMDHWQNICLTKEGPLLIEPQIGNFWTPKIDTDHIYFVLM